MARLVAFLRAVNVGGRFIKMDALRAEFEALGLTSVESFITSGNLIFETRARALPALAAKIEAHLLAVFGHAIPTFLRSDAEVATIARQQPFEPALLAASRIFVVGLLAEPLAAAAIERVAGFESPTDHFHVDGRELYWLSTHQQHESAFSNAAFERALKVRATFRGMNTMQRLAAKYPSAR